MASSSLQVRAMCLLAILSASIDAQAPVDKRRWPADSDTTWALPVKVVLVDTLSAKHGEAIVVREPGKLDEIFIRTDKLTPAVLNRAIRQLRMLRAVQGDEPTASALYRVELRPGGKDPDAEMKRTEKGRQQLDKDMRDAALSAKMAEASKNRHSRQGVGEGKFVEIRFKKVYVKR
jgi:hypothetical protein